MSVLVIKQIQDLTWYSII